MPRPRVFITRQIAEAAIARISQVAEVRVWPGELPPPASQLAGEAKDCQGLLTMLTDRIDAALMSIAPQLRVVSNMAVGYENIDIAEATRRHILVGYTPGVLSETTADLAFALLIAASRRVAEGDRFTRSGKWKTWHPGVLLGVDVHHATLGLVGLGRIGAEVARRAGGFDMKVLYHSRNRCPDEEKRLGVEFIQTLGELISRSDFVSLHVPLTPETRRLIGAAELAQMKSTAILVNTSRGQVVDQKALYEALKEGRIGGAGLDVTEVEPIPLDDPLLTLDNVTITPHIGSASVATRTRMAVVAAENLIAGLQGRPLPNGVNPISL